LWRWGGRVRICCSEKSTTRWHRIFRIWRKNVTYIPMSHVNWLWWYLSVSRKTRRRLPQRFVILSLGMFKSTIEKWTIHRFKITENRSKPVYFGCVWATLNKNRSVRFCRWWCKSASVQFTEVVKKYRSDREFEFNLLLNNG